MNINQLFASMRLKFFLGLIFASTIIISIAFILQDLHEYLGQLENGNGIQIISFIFILALCSAGSYFILKTNKPPVQEINPENLNSLLSIDFKFIGFKFVEGFIDGLLKSNKINHNAQISIPDDSLLNRN